MQEKQNKFGNNKNIVYICTTKNGYDPIWHDESVAQQVEHNTFNVGVPGSSPGGFTEKRQLLGCLFFVNYGRYFQCVVCAYQPFRESGISATLYKYSRNCVNLLPFYHIYGINYTFPFGPNKNDGVLKVEELFA